MGYRYKPLRWLRLRDKPATQSPRGFGGYTPQTYRVNKPRSKPRAQLSAPPTLSVRVRALGGTRINAEGWQKVEAMRAEVAASPAGADRDLALHLCDVYEQQFNEYKSLGGV